MKALYMDGQAKAGDVTGVLAFLQKGSRQAPGTLRSRQSLRYTRQLKKYWDILNPNSQLGAKKR